MTAQLQLQTEKPTANSGFKKLAVQFSTSTFVVKYPQICKALAVIVKRHPTNFEKTSK
jgi:hypothetical protein